ncbi:MAG: OmpA family protein [Planctomycetes bacterium]|nr:OmpA family protein [Planctomycetota bacterium]
MAVGIVSQGCVTAGEYERLKDQLAKANERLDLKDQRLEELDRERLVYEEENLALQEETERHRAHSEKADQIIDDLRNQLELAHKNSPETTTGFEGIEFFATQKEGSGIRFSDDVLFETASDAIRAEAKIALDIVANKLKESDRKIKIAGHTDSVPVVKPETKKKYPHGNVQLSAARALSVYDYLKGKGISEKRMCIVGYGPNEPLVENTTTENKARNRRVEIILAD